MIGYCATGSRGIAITPIRQMKSATTQAKMGRSMKKVGIPYLCLAVHSAVVPAEAGTHNPWRWCLPTALQRRRSN